MATSQLAKDYLGYGTHASRPGTPNTGTGIAPIYRETDTGHTFQWDGTTWQQVDGGSGSFSGEVSGTDFKATGLTGAVAGARFVGGTASGAPASGTFSVGDFIIDQTGKVYVCTVAGTPGTWVQAGGGGSGALTKITETIAGSAVANITFSSISGSYRHLLLTFAVVGDTSATNIDLRAQFNSDTGSNYNWERINFYGGSGASFSSNSVSDTSHLIAYIAANTSPASDLGVGTLWIYDYARTSFNKFCKAEYAFETGTVTTGQLVGQSMGRWNNTAAINTIKLFASAGNLNTNSVVSLYGVS